MGCGYNGTSSCGGSGYSGYNGYHSSCWGRWGGRRQLGLSGSLLLLLSQPTLLFALLLLLLQLDLDQYWLWLLWSCDRIEERLEGGFFGTYFMRWGGASWWDERSVSS